jgi:hypothetical protein
MNKIIEFEKYDSIKFTMWGKTYFGFFGYKHSQFVHVVVSKRKLVKEHPSRYGLRMDEFTHSRVVITEKVWDYEKI